MTRFNTGIIYVPDDYPSIQSAVDNATAGDEIIVRNGSYTEDITVDTPFLIIRSEWGISCSVKQKSDKKHIFKINSDFVTICGFHLKGKDTSGKSGVHISNADNTVISWNRLTYCSYNIRGTNTHNNIIHDNEIGAGWSFYDAWGIWLKNNSNNHIYNNTISGLSAEAVAIHNQNGVNNVIENNFLRGSYCVGLLSGINNTIRSNDMSVGTFWAFMYIENSHYNYIVNNTIRNTSVDGIILTKSNWNNISNNNFTNGGIYVHESYNNILNNNTINGKPLVYLEGETGETIYEESGQIILLMCDNITIVDQNIREVVVGIELINVTYTTIIDSKVNSNNLEGIYMLNSHNILINNCTIHYNDCNIGLTNSNENEILNCSFKTDDYCIYSYESNFNVYCDNKMKGGWARCIELRKSNNNTFCKNEIYGSQSQSFELLGSNHNFCYHNTFRNNHHNPRDLGDNTWDNGYPSGGNYWDEYEGEDKDSDGIGDIPFTFYKNGLDRYPLMEPFGNVRANNNGPYFDFVNNPIQFVGFACGGKPPYNWSWDFGDGYKSYEKSPIHSYTDVGRYSLVLKVADADSNISNHTSWVTIQETNEPPYEPIIKGPTECKAGVSYNFTFSAEDIDENEIWLYIDWGDGNFSEWIGWYKSGEIITVGHKWSKMGNYTLRAKARDGFGDESDWSTFEIYMSDIEIKLSTKLFCIVVKIQNIGSNPIYNITWKIRVDVISFLYGSLGHIFFPQEDLGGIIHEIQGQKENKFRVRVFGFGFLTIDVWVLDEYSYKDFFAFGPFLFL